jgi:hypothetical protein
MAKNVADVLWEMLVNAGVKRCYGIVGDALNPVIDALRRSGKIEFIHVRNSPRWPTLISPARRWLFAELPAQALYIFSMR